MERLGIKHPTVEEIQEMLSFIPGNLSDGIIKDRE